MNVTFTQRPAAERSAPRLAAASSPRAPRGPVRRCPPPAGVWPRLPAHDGAGPAGAPPGAGRGRGRGRRLLRAAGRGPLPAVGPAMGLCLPCMGGAVKDVVETPDPVSAGPRQSPGRCPFPSVVCQQQAVTLSGPGTGDERREPRPCPPGRGRVGTGPPSAARRPSRRAGAYLRGCPGERPLGCRRAPEQPPRTAAALRTALGLRPLAAWARERRGLGTTAPGTPSLPAAPPWALRGERGSRRGLRAISKGRRTLIWTQSGRASCLWLSGAP